MRILALDYGDKTVGVAITDGLNLMAHPMNTIFREKPTKLRQTLSKIIEIIDDNKVKTIVIGLPKNLDSFKKKIVVQKLMNLLINLGQDFKTEISR